MNIFRKILALLDRNEKKQALLIMFLILIMTVFDMIGIASIVPFVTLLTNTQLIETNYFLKELFLSSKVMGVSNIQEFLILVGFIVFFLLIISLSLRAFTTFVQTKFILMREQTIGVKLIEGYLGQPYSWFLNKDSSELGKSVLSEVNQVILNTFNPIMNIIVQGAIVFGMLTILIIIDYELALGIFSILSLTYIFIFLILKNYLSKLGTNRLKANSLRFNSLTEVFGAIKEAKISGLERVYISLFSKSAKIFASSHLAAQVIGILPRYLIEAVAFGGMIIMIIFLMYNDGNFLNILPIIALYAFAGYRLMPALQQIYTAITQLRFSGPALDVLHKDITDLSINSSEVINSPKIFLKHCITLENIYFKYPGSSKNALNKINIEIPALSKIGITGKTGSGKTTIVDIILGLLEINNGGLLKVDNNEINKNNIRSWQKTIGYVPQKIFLSNNSIEANIAFGVKNEDINIKQIIKVSKIANLHDFVTNELPKAYKTYVGENGIRLSGGQKQRIGIARALYKNPQLLVLDEATNSLDNLTERLILKNIDDLSEKLSTILITHRLSSLKNCNKIFLIEKGELIDTGTFDYLEKNNRMFKEMASGN
jgi:ABC-type multidrug transport system fused ATPase/permease subunit